ncbi:MAG: hypothetical protein U5L72_09935 [Bacteroidales bacterium]|nr:hypothetical protein [Bacteroidales bacterium]
MKFKFSYPVGWKLTNAPTQVTIQPSDGKALILLTLSNQKSLQAAADSTLAQYGLQPQRAERRTVNGMPAIVALSKQENKNQSTGAVSVTTVLSYFIEYGTTYYVLHSVSSEADFPNYANIMESSMKTFAKLTDSYRINVKPQRVYVKKVQRTGTLESALSYYGMKQVKMQELALLNNLDLNDRCRQENLFKIVAGQYSPRNWQTQTYRQSGSRSHARSDTD